MATLIARFYAERNREYLLDAPVTSVGRARENSIRIPDPRISNRHVRITRDGADYVLEVVASDVVTRLNGRSVTAGERRRLRADDVIALSDLEFRFSPEGRDGAAARIAVVEGVHRGKVFRVEDGRVGLGRAVGNGIQFPDRTVSRRHCLLRRDGEGRWWVEDRDSTNGTFLNDVRVDAPARVVAGDEVALGFSRFRFQPDEVRETEPQAVGSARWN